MTNLHCLKYLIRTAGLAAAACAFMSAAQAQSASAQSDQGSSALPPAVSGWKTDTTPATQSDAAKTDDSDAAKPPIALTSEQISLLANINAYLNTLINVEGRFVQTDHRNEETRGKFYVRRPGKLRFDYAAPSKLRIVSDGEYLSIEDHDLNTIDKFPLDATPIQLLLGQDVNLTRDAIILDMKQDDSAVVVTLRDRSGTAAGQLQLFFKRPELELYEWVITDAQGLDTRIQLGDLTLGEEKEDTFFAASDIELKNLSNN